MNLLATLRAGRDLKRDVRRWAAVTVRFAEHLENALGPAGMRALRSDAAKDVRDRYVRATTEFTRSMSECDGSPASVAKVSSAVTSYLQAYLRVLELAAKG